MPDVRLHIDDSGGDGRPVVLIHGWPLSAESWDDQTDALVAAGHRVVAYDRRGFGRSDKPDGGFDYDTLAADLDRLLTDLDLRDVTLVGFSMGGGEVARYVAAYGQDRLRSVVFAAAVPPYLLQSDDNPDGPLPEDLYLELRGGLESDRDAFLDEFLTGFFSTAEGLQVSEEQRQQAVALARQSSQAAALATMDAWATTDFRDDLGAISVPTLVIHGDGDQTVPFEGSGRRTHAAIDGSELHVVEGAPHGLNVSHAEEFNRALLDFLSR
jgi:pimeloyl-ACP methyl ester carboxylesterase